MSSLRVLLATITATIVVGAGLTAAPADADVPAFQDARNRQVKHFKITYKRVCPTCAEGEQPRHGIPAVASGIAKFAVSTYKILDQNRRWDFYIVDVSGSLVRRSGDEDWGWMDVTLTSIGKTRIARSSYTLGRGVVNKETCKSYPIELGVGFYGVSAGTTAGHVRFCHKGSKIESSGVTKGRRYHATGLSGIANMQAQRYVQVRQGAAPPKFKVHVTTNHDSLSCPTLSDGTHCFVGHGMHSKSIKIGSTPQR